MSDDSGTNGASDRLGQSFAAALAAASAAPQSEDAWDHLEELADSLQRPDEVAAAYRSALEGDLERDVWTKLSRKAAGFHEEWFGDDPEALNALLGMILERDPAADWAYERLTMALTLGERWDDLLGLYDRVLHRTTDPLRRKQLLDDAASAAKDFAKKPGRAVDYMQMQLEIDPGNHKLAAAIERLLARQNRWEDLVELWQARLPELAVAEARATRLKVAQTFLRHIEAAPPALEELRTLLSDAPGHPEACAELEYILGNDAFGSGVRTEALGLLRTNYEAADRPVDLVGAVERAIEFSEGLDGIALHREAGVRLAILGRDPEALTHYTALLAEDPTDTDARRQLRQLARRSSLVETQVDALVAAAALADPGQAAALLVEAAGLCRTTLDDHARATELYRKVLEIGDADPQMALTAAHQLGELLEDESRRAERLDVLERLAVLEPAAEVRRAVLGEVGRLADELDDPDRALAAYAKRLEDSTQDLLALDATIEILRARERWPQLCDALRRRADTVNVAQQRRADLVALARVQAEKLEAFGDAIASWLQIREEFGDEAETIEALDGLMATAMRFEELAVIIDAASTTRRLGAASLLTRLGELCRLHLGRPADATAFHAQALTVEPDDTTSRAALVALCDDPDCVAAASEALVQAHRRQKEWQEVLGLLEVRLDAAADPARAVDVLREAAQLQEDMAADPAAACRSVGRALGFDPGSTSLEASLLRLAALSEQFDEASTALGNAAAAAGSPRRATELLMARAQIVEGQLGDSATAVSIYQQAAEQAPDDLDVARALIRASASATAWAAASEAAVAICRARQVVDTDALESLSAAAQRHEAWPALTAAFAESLNDVAGLPVAVARDLNLQLARWYLDACEDVDAAAEATAAAHRLTPEHRETLEQLAAVQRRQPASRFGERPALCETLVALDAGSPDIEALHEATEAAVDAEADPAYTRDLVVRLYRKAGRLLATSDHTSAVTNPEHTPRGSTLFAVEHLVRTDIDAGRQVDAIATLQAAAELPLPRTDVLDLRLQAARLCAGAGQRGRAIDLLGRVTEERDDDVELVRELAELCDAEGRTLELLAARTRELGLTFDAPRRLELRLELSALVGQVEQLGGRVESLRSNLEDEPGHAPTLDALRDVLGDKGRLPELADVLCEQAQRLEDAEDGERAAALWSDAAKLIEGEFDDVPRAIECLQRVAALAPTEDTLDHLARLHLQQGAPGKAAAVLTHRLEATDPSSRVPVLLRLARAQLAAELSSDATTTLQTAFDEAPRSKEARKLLMKQYRDAGSWAPLAQTLTRAAEHVTDAGTVLDYAREAAEIYAQRLDAPEQAVPILSRAAQLHPDDRKLLAPLAMGLRTAGRHDEAAEVLEKLIGSFGRRRSTERAAAHLELARVARARADIALATDQLELASSMDATNPAILQALAETARADGQLERAERAYRTLLIQVRRRTAPAPATASGDPVIGSAEVLYELSRIAADRGDAEQAQELVESALEAVAEEESEGVGLCSVLRHREDHELLARVLDVRLLHADTPRRRAEALCELAELQQTHGQDESAALESRLKALRADPASSDNHTRTRALAESLGRAEEYVELAETLLEKARRSSDVYVRCELLLRLAEAMAERGNHARAAELIASGEELGVREVDVWRTAARIAAIGSDTATQMSYLERLASVGEQETETRADALFRMAEVHLANEDSIDRGLRVLTEAVELAPRYGRACRILARATASGSTHAELLATYDRIARKAGDDATVLAAIERRADHPDTPPEDVREGVELALALEDPQRAEALMLRAVELAGGLIDAQGRATWALVGLAERRHAEADVAGAVKWLCEAIESADDPLQLLDLAHAVVEPAVADGGDLTLAVKVYEALLERDGSEPRIWQPLAELYRKLGGLDRLQRLVEDTIDSIGEASERNALRLELAQTLLAAGERDADAIEILQGVLLESPDHPTALPLLVDVLQRAGRGDELIGVLQEQLMAAQAKGDIDAIATMSLRISELQRGTDVEEAISTIRGALDYDEDRVELLRRLAELLDGVADQQTERAEILERLIAVEDAETAAQIALELATHYGDADDADGRLRTLVAGYRQNPQSLELRAALESTYEAAGDYRGLAELLIGCADREESVDNQVALLRQAAAIHRDFLSDSEASADILERAYGVSPNDASLALELVSGLASAGKYERATTLVSGLLDAPDLTDEIRLGLLSTRADLLGHAGDQDGAIEDLEAAMLLDPNPVLERLFEALEQRRAGDSGEIDPALERGTVLRLAELAMLRDDRVYAKTLLGDWVDKQRKDADALRALRDIHVIEEEWDKVSKIAARQVAVESGEAQVEAALMLSEACKRRGEHQEAKPGLEHARRKQPENPQIRGELRDVYEHMGAHLELAKILAAEAAEQDDVDTKLERLRRAASLFVSVGDVESAMPAIEEILSLNPGDPEATVALADAYLAAAQLDDADELLDRAIAESKVKRGAPLAMMLQRKGRAAGARGDRDAQLELLQQAFAAHKNDGEIAAELADLAESMESWDLAVRVLRTITLLDTPCPISRVQAFLRQAQICLRRDDRQRALLWARKAKHEDPEDPEVMEFLSSLGES